MNFNIHTIVIQQRYLYLPLLALVALCCAQFTQAQVPDSIQALPVFSFSVAPVSETCAGNGALKFTVYGGDPAASVVFRVYNSNGDSTMVATNNGSVPGAGTATAAGLFSGNYHVVATQMRPGYSSNIQEWDGVLDQAWEALALGEPVVTNTINGNDGAITVTVTAGKPVSFYTISGPVMVTAQPSNILKGLAAGTYVIACKDACGNVKTRTVAVRK